VTTRFRTTRFGSAVQDNAIQRGGSAVVRRPFGQVPVVAVLSGSVTPPEVTLVSGTLGRQILPRLAGKGWRRQ
jgi:hypothetical protein